jgi:hypothetical protein
MATTLITARTSYGVKWGIHGRGVMVSGGTSICPREMRTFEPNKV